MLAHKPRVALLSLALSLAAARPGDACEWGRSALAAARRHADKGEWYVVYSFATSYDEKADLHALLPFGTEPDLVEAQHLAAVSCAHRAGERGPFHLADSIELGEGDAQRNLHWAALALRWQLATVDNSPRRKVELAIALSGIDHHADVARAMLVELAALDVMPNADGWGLLARLEHQHGDARAEAAARAQCRELDATSPACGT